MLELFFIGFLLVGAVNHEGDHIYREGIETLDRIHQNQLEYDLDHGITVNSGFDKR